MSSSAVPFRANNVPTAWSHSFQDQKPTEHYTSSGKLFNSASLGQLVSRLLVEHPNESILIVAPSNRAVDVVVSQLVDRLIGNNLYDIVRDRRLLRFGYPKRADVLEISELLGPAYLDELTRTANRISREISAIEREQRKHADIALMRANLLAAQEAVKDAVREHVSNCSVVATTTTLAYMPNSPIAARTWDTVIIDEVTMVPPAVCAYLASKARRRFLLAGDPCQLGPVFEERATTDANTKKWLKDDVFVMGGLSSGQLAPDAINISDSRLARITSQRRCTTDIWNCVSHIYPQFAYSASEKKLRPISNLPPAPGAAVTFIDLSGHGAKCEQSSHSWLNAESGQVALKVVAAMASRASEKCSIAIISPYRAQIKMLRQLICERRKSGNPLFENIEAGTVHQFQGSEADAVVFDVVDGSGRRNLGLLLRGNAGTRLLNVAVSRAKGKLVVVADREWCRNADVAEKNSLLAQLVFGRDSINRLSPDEIECDARFDFAQ